MEPDYCKVVHEMLKSASEIVHKIFNTKINNGDYTVKEPIATLIAGLSIIHRY